MWRFLFVKNKTKQNKTKGDDTRMFELQLKKGDMFTLHFDFGDSYRFFFKLLDINPGRAESDVTLVSAVGEPVIQYPGTSFDLLDDLIT